jgi:predicted Zn-dependent peptidase
MSMGLPLLTMGAWLVCGNAAGARCTSPSNLQSVFLQPAETPQRALTAPPEPPAPGRAIEIWVDRASGVTSAWLSNGVLLHHKFLKVEPPKAEQPADGAADGRRRDRQIPSVAVFVTIAGAELLEVDANRGVSDAAVAAAWDARSVRSMMAGELDAFLDATGATIRCSGGSDSFMVNITGDAAQMEPALRGVRLMLCEPVVDAEALKRWQEQTVKQFEDRKRTDNNAIAKVIGALFGPQEVRARPAQGESVNAITAEQAQTWLSNALGASADAKAMPMEVAIVGDIAVDRAISLAEMYFGSLPARERMAEATLADKRIATRAKRPEEVIEVPDWKGSPLVLVGFFGADIRDIADHRALAVAARILSNRMDRLPPDQNEGNHAAANAMPASVYPGFGLFLATTHAQAGSEAGASDNIHKLLDDVKVNGPSAEELSVATQYLSGSAAKMLADPSYWSWMLAHSTYQGMRIAEIGVADRVYREMQPEMVTAALKKYWTPERSIKLIVKPGTEGKAAPAER